jgi:hypothetical protein
MTDPSNIAPATIWPKTPKLATLRKIAMIPTKGNASDQIGKAVRQDIDAWPVIRSL